MNVGFCKSWVNLKLKYNVCWPGKLGCLQQMTAGDVISRKRQFHHISIIQKAYAPVYDRKLFPESRTYCQYVHLSGNVVLINSPFVFSRIRVGKYFSTDPISKMATKEQTDSELSVGHLVDELVKRASEKDIMVRSVPKPKLTEELKDLLNVFGSSECVDLLVKFPKLVMNIPQLTDLISLLKELGFAIHDIMTLARSYPRAFMVTRRDVMTVYETLQTYGFSVDNIVQMINRYPKILEANLEQVPYRIDELKDMFKTKDTLNLLANSPHLLFIDFQEIREKFDYVFHEMGITQPQMRYSKLFLYTMDHIHVRHMFLVRTGFFKKVKRKQGQIDLNPKLDTIMDTTDEEFVRKFGNMSIQDYRTFQKQLKKEMLYLKEIGDQD